MTNSTINGFEPDERSFENATYRIRQPLTEGVGKTTNCGDGAGLPPWVKHSTTASVQHCTARQISCPTIRTPPIWSH